MTTQIKEKYKFEVCTHYWFDLNWLVAFDWEPTLDEVLDKVAEDIKATASGNRLTATRMSEILDWEKITICYKKDDMDDYEQITDEDMFASEVNQ